jgi:hypothetical protein
VCLCVSYAILFDSTICACVCVVCESECLYCVYMRERNKCFLFFDEIMIMMMMIMKSNCDAVVPLS